MRSLCRDRKTRTRFIVDPFSSGLCVLTWIKDAACDPVGHSVTRGGKPPQWQWEISRRPKALGVRFYAKGFRSEKAAKLAGEKALRKLLDGIAREQRA